jgi:hypothetical protein
LKEQVGSGELTIWQVDKTHGNAIVSKQTHTSPVGSLASAGFPVGYQFTDSENHTEWTHSSKPTFDRELKTLYETVYSGVQGSFGKGSTPDKPEYDVGGDFFTQKLTVQVVNPSEQVITGIGYDTQYSNWSAKYRGPILCGALSDMAVPPIVLGNLNTVGATAIARCSPTNNIASAANFLHELRQEGMPKLFGLSLLKERARFFRGLGEEYLNKEFGWDPLIGDVKAIAFAITHAHEVLQQYERDSGKVVRRRYEFPEEITESTTTMRASDAFLGNYATGVFNPVNPGGDPLEILREGGSTGTLFRRRQTRRKVWFSGAFTYHLPWGYNSRIGMIESARHAQTLLGLDITPEILWNAAPWTWAIDWFSNAGDVVANLSDWATDGLVMKYGYVMEHQIVTDTYYVDKLGRLQKSTKAQPSPVIVSLETKRRVKASPFGFGITWSGLSPRQIAISVALGLTRGIRR